ncbi:MAG: helix-turn-helix domain-containing protein [Pseudonocardia sp.]|nr:helix-turn-helix domain-containing protein [Pseudonocardia sp.]
MEAGEHGPALGPVVVRRRLGAALKRLRTAKGLHLDVVAKSMEMSPAKLSRLETGHVAPKLRDVRDLLEEYDAPEATRGELLQWAEDAKGQGWWQPFTARVVADLDLYISLEAEASALKVYCTCVHGLLQTEQYARMLLEGVAPQRSVAQREELVEIRLRRQRVLDEDRGAAPPLVLHVVMDEAALYRGPAPNHPIMGDIMATQIGALMEAMERPNVTLQVLPFEACYDEACSTFAIFEPRVPNDWTVVNVESTLHDAYYDTSAEVSAFRAIWEDLVARADSPEATLSRLREASERSHAAVRRRGGR